VGPGPRARPSDRRPRIQKFSDNGAKLGAQDRAHVGQGLDDLGTLVEAEGRADFVVVVLDPLD